MKQQGRVQSVDAKIVDGVMVHESVACSGRVYVVSGNKPDDTTGATTVLHAKNDKAADTKQQASAHTNQAPAVVEVGMRVRRMSRSMSETTDGGECDSDKQHV